MGSIMGRREGLHTILGLGSLRRGGGVHTMTLFTLLLLEQCCTQASINFHDGMGKYLNLSWGPGKGQKLKITHNLYFMVSLSYLFLESISK